MSDPFKLLERLAAESNPPSALTSEWEFAGTGEWGMRDRAPYQFNGDNPVFELSVQPTFLQLISGGSTRPYELRPKHLKSEAYLSSMLNPYESAYWWPRILFSLNSDGDKSSNKFAEKYPVLINRSKHVILTFDNGGYTARKIPPGAYYTPQRLACSRQICERFGDWAFIFDHPPSRRFPFDDCLSETDLNLRWLRDHMEGRTNWIVVCQAPDDMRAAPEQAIELAIRWWDVVKAPIMEGEMTGVADTLRSFRADVMLEFLRHRIDEGAFALVKRYHALAANKPKTAVLLSIIQRVLREHVNPEIEVTFDSALAFSAAGTRYRAFDGLRKPSPDFGANIVGRLREFLIGRETPLDTDIYLNSPVYPPDTPIKAGEILQVRDNGNVVLDPLGLSTLCSHSAWQQINLLLNAYDEADRIFGLPRFHQHMDTGRAKLFRAVADALDSSGTVEPALAEYVAANRLTHLAGELPPGFWFFPQHDIEDFQIAAEAVEAILVGPKPDEALKKHRRLLANWF